MLNIDIFRIIGHPNISSDWKFIIYGNRSSYTVNINHLLLTVLTAVGHLLQNCCHMMVFGSEEGGKWRSKQSTVSVSYCHV